MNIKEYEQIKKLKYREYCDYLKKKYGTAKENYFDGSFKKNKNVSRTKEGLICHHICEDRTIMLSTLEYAEMCPYEYQKAKNLVYCDYLEHLLLHIMIVENPKPDIPGDLVGYGGAVNFIIPELNDVYSGFVTKQQWRLTCHKLIINDKDVYLKLLQRLIIAGENTYNLFIDEKDFFTSFNDQYGIWKKENNEKLFKEIEDSLWND